MSILMLSSLIRNVCYPLNERREGTFIRWNQRRLERTQYLPLDQLLNIQWQKLQKLIQHSYEHVPYYRNRFDLIGLKPKNIQTPDDFRRIPPLTKIEIAQNLDELRAANIPQSKCHRAATGGSTGRHTPFYRDNYSLNIKRAAQFRFDGFTGWRIGEKVAHVWPAIQDFTDAPSWKQRLRQRFVDRSIVFPAGNLTEQQIERIGTGLEIYQPGLIRAFPNALAIVAAFLEGRKGLQVRPKGVIVTGEPLLESQRDLFQRVFGCPVFDCYVSRECGQHACECEVHESMHINADCLYLEFETAGRPSLCGEPGEILVTDLDNYGMPFIRYKIQDIGIPVAGTCRCGRTLPRMAVHAGRVSDFVVSPFDSSLVSGSALCHYLLACGPDVGQIQIIQDAPDHLTIRVKVETQCPNRPTVDTSHVLKVVDQLFQSQMRVSFDMCETIPHEPSGKYRFCINRLGPATIPGDSTHDGQNAIS